MKAILLGRQLAAKSTDEIAAEIENLPDGLREEALWAAFKETDQQENVLGLLDLFIEEEAWSRLEDPETPRGRRTNRRGLGGDPANPPGDDRAVPPQRGNLFPRGPGRCTGLD